MTKEEEQKKYSNFFTALYRAVEQEATEKKREKNFYLLLKEKL